MGFSLDAVRQKIINLSGINQKKVSSAAQYANTGHYPEKRTKSGTYKYIKSYLYTKDGVIVYRKNRYEKRTDADIEKVFDFWMVKDGKWQISCKADPIQTKDRVLYNTDAIAAAKEKNKPLVIVEGEKDVDTLSRLDICVVTAGGVHEWQSRFAKSMEGLVVCIIPDNDIPGEKAAMSIVSDLVRHGVNCKLFKWEKVSEELGFPGITKQKHGEDISDLNAYLMKKGEVLSLQYILDRCLEVSPEDQSIQLDKKNYPLNDVGNALRLISKYGQDIRYCPEWNMWLLFDGYWKTDKLGEIFAKARAVVKEMEETGRESDDEALFKFAIKSGFNGRIQALTEQTKTHSEFGIPQSSSWWDKNNQLICLENCTIDLKLYEKSSLFEIRTHSREDYITKQMPIKYDSNAVCEKWMRFLEDIIPDENTRAFISRAVGYSLTGDTSEDAMFILYGTGSNGKSTFVETISAMLGDYAKTINPDTLLHKDKNNGPNTEIASICGARFVRCSEQDEGRRLSESLIKQITSGEPVSARFLYGKDFEYLPTYKIWFSTNHKPQIRGTDDGIWRRICLIPFDVQIPKEKRDGQLDQKLKKELPGILNWALNGLMEYKRIGLSPPVKVTGAVQEYRSEQDVLGDFIEDVIIESNKNSVMASKLYKAYESFCERNGIYRLSQTKFGTKLSERGYKKMKTAGLIHYTGIKIAEEWNTDDIIPLPGDQDSPFN